MNAAAKTAEQAGEDIGLLQVRRVETLGLGDDIAQQYPGVAHLAISGLAQDPVRKTCHLTLGALSELGDLRGITDIERRRDGRDLGVVDGNGRKRRTRRDNFSFRHASPRIFLEYDLCLSPRQ